jgi:putative endonuclease
MFYVYLLYSTRDNGFYIGYSTDLKRRLSEHKRSASFATKSRGPWRLIYYEAYTGREDAEGREKFLKNGAGRHFLRAQLRHYLEKFPARAKGRRLTRPSRKAYRQDVPTFHQIAARGEASHVRSSHVSESSYVGDCPLVF